MAEQDIATQFQLSRVILHATNVERGLQGIAQEIPGCSIDVNTTFNSENPQILAQAVLQGPVSVVRSDKSLGAQVEDTSSTSLHFIPDVNVSSEIDSLPRLNVACQIRHRQSILWPDRIL